MPISPADIEALIEELHRDPQLRDRVRNAILADDFLALPGIVARLGERVEALTAKLDALTLQVAELVAVVKQHDGHLGNLEGRLFELDYRDRLPSRLGRMYEKVRQVHIPELEAVSAAYRRREIAPADWDDLLEIDAAAMALPRVFGDERGQEMLVVLELSRTVNADDVRRIHRRAEILRRLGYQVDAVVDGEQIRRDAKELANSLGVIALVIRDVTAA